MIRKQVYLTPAEDAKLKRLAQATGRTEAEIIRLSLDLLPEEEAPVLLNLAREGLLEFPEHPCTPAKAQEVFQLYLARLGKRRLGLSQAVIEGREGR